MRTVNLTVRFEDNDVIEQQLRQFLRTHLGGSIVDIKTLPNTDKLYEEDPVFKRLLKAQSKNKREVQDYINKHNFSQ